MHSDFENLVVHNDTEIFRDVSPEGRNVVIKIIKIIQSVYGEDGVYPLSEFSFGFIEDDFLIFDRNSVYIKDVPVSTFSESEIEWILSNLNIFNPEAGFIPTNYPVVSFTHLRDEEYLVWRVPNSTPVLLGSILYNISSDVEDLFVFHPRTDGLIITDDELEEIQAFIKEVSNEKINGE